MNLVESGCDVNIDDDDDDDDDCLFLLIFRIAQRTWEMWKKRRSDVGAQPNFNFFALYFYHIRNTFDANAIMRWLHSYMVCLTIHCIYIQMD